MPRRESDTIVRVEYMVAADEGHNIERRHHQIEPTTRTARFLADAMGPP